MIKELIQKRFILIFGIFSSVITILFRFGYIYHFKFSNLDFDFLPASLAAVFAGFFYQGI